jgi:hypothetical protein
MSIDTVPLFGARERSEVQGSKRFDGKVGIVGKGP